MPSLAKTIWHQCVDFVYPPLCLSCKLYLKDRKALFCEPCLTKLHWINPKFRCICCFRPLDRFSLSCKQCRTTSCGYIRVAAAFEETELAVKILREFWREDRYGYYELMCSFMIMQFYKMGWPLPDLISYIPTKKLARLQKGEDGNRLLAKMIASHLQIPFADLLKRRLFPDDLRFKWTKDMIIGDKVILLISDCHNPKSRRYREISYVLSEGCARKLYFLSFTSMR